MPQLRESDIQAQIVEALSYHSHNHNFLFFSVPNEHDFSAAGKQRYAKVNALKKRGLTPGVADLVIVKAGRAYFLEVKTQNGNWSDNQRRFFRKATAVGAPYAVARSYEEAIAVCKEWGIFT